MHLGINHLAHRYFIFYAVFCEVSISESLEFDSEIQARQLRFQPQAINKIIPLHKALCLLRIFNHMPSKSSNLHHRATTRFMGTLHSTHDPRLAGKPHQPNARFHNAAICLFNEEVRSQAHILASTGSLIRGCSCVCTALIFVQQASSKAASCPDHTDCRSEAHVGSSTSTRTPSARNKHHTSPSRHLTTGINNLQVLRDSHRKIIREDLAKYDACDGESNHTLGGGCACIVICASLDNHILVRNATSLCR